MSGVFLTCALATWSPGCSTTPTRRASFDNIGVPASFYFLWAVHRLHRDSARDWNRRPLVGRAAPRGSPFPVGAEANLPKLPRSEWSLPVQTSRFDERGLVPCVIQDWRSGEVLTLAYMNEEALAPARETGELHLFSRSRNELWHKGATSGNTQAVKALRFDCDNDAVLALVEPAGPACHTGERTCFFAGDLRPRCRYEALPGLERTLARPRRAPAPRAPTRPSCSPTRRSSARRSRRRPRRSRAPRARSPTSAWPTRPPTSSTTSPCCSRAAA